MLKALGIPVETQTLVFSKTSFHRDYIRPGNPRAVYASQDAFVGWVPGAPDLEIAVGDERLGTVLYTLT